jgi:protein O-mannosyl-transferase
VKLSTLQIAKWFLGIGLTVYVGSLQGPYHFDDTHSVESNLAVRSLANIPSFWSDPKTSSFVPENRVYRPLVYTFYSLFWAAGGGSTLPFHLAKVLMHALVALALYLIWARLWREPGWFSARDVKMRLPFFSQVLTLDGRAAAFFLAILFLVHPACSECVDYISATTSLQCALFYVWAFYAYLLHRDSGSPRFLGLALFLYFCSVASKEEGITLPAMIFITELFLLKEPSALRKRGLRAAKVAFPYLLLGVVLFAWIMGMRPPEGHESRGWRTPFEYFVTQWRMYLWYMRLWFWPWGLNADDASTQFSDSLLDPLVIQAAIGNALLLWSGWALRRRFPAFLYGLCWYYVTIAPASSVVVLAEASNEHRMYLSYIGFVGGTFTLILAAIDRFMTVDGRDRFLGRAYLAVVVCLVIGTQSRNRVWASSESLWLDTIEKNPTSGRAYNNLALVYLGRAEYERAVTALKKCEGFWSTYAYCPLNRGIAQEALGAQAEAKGNLQEATALYRDAEQAFLRAYELGSRNVHANFHLGSFYEKTRKDPLRAIEYYQAAIRVTGGRYPAAELRIADCFTALKRYDEAKAAVVRALEVEPLSEFAWLQKARIEDDQGHVEEARESYRRLLAISPDNVKALYNLGVLDLSASQTASALERFKRVVSLDPSSDRGWFNLSVAAERVGDGRVALEAAQRLLALGPGNPQFRARLEALKKRFGEGKS